jgi:hypothetical protein
LFTLPTMGKYVPDVAVEARSSWIVTEERRWCESD